MKTPQWFSQCKYAIIGLVAGAAECMRATDSRSLACMHTEMHSRVRVVYDTVAQRKSQFIRDQSVLRLHIVHTCRQRSMRRALALVARSQCAMKTLIHLWQVILYMYHFDWQNPSLTHRSPLIIPSVSLVRWFVNRFATAMHRSYRRLYR